MFSIVAIWSGEWLLFMPFVPEILPVAPLPAPKLAPPPMLFMLTLLLLLLAVLPGFAGLLLLLLAPPPCDSAPIATTVEWCNGDELLGVMCPTFSVLELNARCRLYAAFSTLADE